MASLMENYNVVYVGNTISAQSSSAHDHQGEESLRAESDSVSTGVEIGRDMAFWLLRKAL